MLLVDIGNTNIHFAQTKGKAIIKTFTLLTRKLNANILGNTLKSHNVKELVVCSVVPKATSLFKQTAIKAKIKIYIAGVNLKIPIKSFYNKKQIGMDRLVASYSACKLFKGSRIIIDFGTAITFDFISKKGDYLGGFIMPGIGSSLKVLSGCALLPDKIKLQNTKCFIPRNTVDSISKGVEEGFSSMANYMVKKYSKLLKIAPRTKVVVTGGDERVILNSLDFNYIFEPNLVLKGLLLLTKSL